MMRAETGDTGRRKAAGKALAIFLAFMGVLTLINRTLTDMVIPTVTATASQRGALEIQIQGDGVLVAAVNAPVVPPEAARVKEIHVKSGAGVNAKDALLTLDYSDVIKEKHGALSNAVSDAAAKQQAYDRASVDVSSSAVATLNSRREALEKAEAALLEAQEKLDAASGEEEIAAAQSALNRALSDVDYRKRKVEELTGVRAYIDAGKDLTAAREKLAEAAEEYFGLNRLLITNPYEGADESALIEGALKAVKSGGTVADAIPFDGDVEYLSLLTSPVMGDVIDIGVSVGSVVPTNAAVMTVSDRSRELSLTVQVDESKVGDMAAGDVAQITVDSDVYDCPITGISPSIDNPGLFDVEFILPGDAGAVGMRASMSFKKRTQNYDILIPLSALRTDNEGSFVYVIDQQDGSLGSNLTVRRVTVYVLEKDSTRAALQSGITARDLLVTRSDRSISDGDRVRLEGN